jgi:hypothetical protein
MPGRGVKGDKNFSRHFRFFAGTMPKTSTQRRKGAKAQGFEIFLEV